ncbi:hypothetical protein [Kitasatospora cineracea]|uniref:Uncharacterized protein n=1 Tax=Kitasatospora cineracea TaxID=88074 RepID=A0A3N4S2C5_9ACTN|nr:hypothetical protein [Kitasatospora cineracea]ROR46920.1 hypothetical protein EDD39_5217 [Kitasatospora cineracea]RPE37085.1 hypothetical protein EDD38_5471 [Kitasatospora cineracea]
MSATTLLLLAPLVLAAVLTLTAPSLAHRHRRTGPAALRSEHPHRPRHARPTS